MISAFTVNMADHATLAGSKTDFPQDLLNQVKRLEDLFTVDTQTLKKITDHFVSELAKGMASESCHVNVYSCLIENL